MLRHCDATHFTLWFVSREPLTDLTLRLGEHEVPLQDADVHYVPLGQHAHQYLIMLSRPELLTPNRVTNYQVSAAQHGDIFANISQLNYGDASSPSVRFIPELTQVFHGSCRNPHHHSDDALVAADTYLAKRIDTGVADDRPALIVMSGDQVYIDDVAGPMLNAIGQVIDLLGLQHEQFEGANIASSEALHYQPADLYQRHKNLLPHTQYPAKTALWRWYRNHPIFTSSIAENHLVSLNEIIALYLLTWSPELWELVNIPKDVDGLTPANSARWQNEWQHLLGFKAGLTQVRRFMAHIPVYMMFDDHDVTDDWNLTAKWELAAYEHAFSKRIIGNALIGYTLFQGLGNAPDKFTDEIRPLLDAFFAQPQSESQDLLIEELLKFEQWHYTLATSPKLVVLDTRTRRWRSESNLAKPSGLMDWEALMDLQQELLGQSKVIIVSPAPMFGVKLIEAIQRTATLMGASLLVDAENWMAHPGAANALLSIFMHRKTPEEFVILSGDVHYSFSYDISIRFRRSSPNIYQITCSGIKNHFPEKLLPIFDKLNGWLYGHFSPLNLLTKRKRMSLRGRRPNGAPSKRLVNKSGIGILELADDGAPTKIAVLHGDMSETLFEPPKQE
ncbi:alkaline phosphatase D family protein [Shewanella vaxholmensis]|uniref:alkaline phosphatase D family protein n=1 Tax=Shewanella vaxholmensis TaxID=3063535 RepID=UPI00288EC70B|nr:alkaline phosphatase D family protein [Shewanella sp. SP1S1-4]MDT3308404.1 alkaline phosphatase D family protein [Shewanella sp. SP1S1-4]